MRSSRWPTPLARRAATCPWFGTRFVSSAGVVEQDAPIRILVVDDEHVGAAVVVAEAVDLVRLDRLDVGVGEVAPEEALGIHQRVGVVESLEGFGGLLHQLPQLRHAAVAPDDIVRGFETAAEGVGVVTTRSLKLDSKHGIGGLNRGRMIEIYDQE